MVAWGKWNFSSHIEVDISQVSAANEWDTQLTVKEKFHISARPSIILYLILLSLALSTQNNTQIKLLL